MSWRTTVLIVSIMTQRKAFYPANYMMIKEML